MGGLCLTSCVSHALFTSTECLNQRARQGSVEINAISRLTGLVASTTPRRAKPVGSAM